MLSGVEKALPDLIKIATGELTHTVLTNEHEPIEIGPTVSERIKAADVLLKYGLGTKTEVSGPDGGPIETHAVTTVDFSSLSDEEMRTLKPIAEKLYARSEPDGD